MLSLSMEIELGWGSVFSPSAERHSQFSGPERTLETKRLQQLLELCEKYDLPISFDVVGHLLLDSCDGHDAPHREWFQEHDPMDDEDRSPLYYAPDLVADISNSDTPHEICTHTYSHIPTDEMSPESVSWELTRSQTAHEQAGYPEPTSLVTPQHRSISLEVARDNGIVVLRTPDKAGSAVDNYPKDGGLIERYLWNFQRNPPTAKPEWKDGVLQVFCSSGPSLTSPLLPRGQNDPHPTQRMVPLAFRKSVHRSYLSSALDAAKDGKHVHLWCHLWDLANDIQWPIVREFLVSIGKAKKNGMKILTFEQIESHLK